MFIGIHHVALVVSDPEAAMRYYGAVAGLQRLPDSTARLVSPGHEGLLACGSPPFDQYLLAGRNGFLEILSPRGTAIAPNGEGNPINRPGIRHFCVQNNDCSILEAAVLSNGGSLIAPPLDLGTGNQYAYARDPEGNIIEIEGLPYTPASEATWLGHVAIVTRNMDAVIAFYAALFGTVLKSRGQFGPGPQFDRMGGLTDARIEGAWLPAGNMQLELWQFHTPQYPLERGPNALLDPGYSHICLECDQLDQDLARLIDLGGQVISGIMENDAARSVFARDPEGNIIELLELLTGHSSLSIASLASPDVCERIEAGG